MDFKPKDCARLIHGPTHEMTVSEINEETKEVTCVYYDTLSKKHITITLPEVVLQHCPRKATDGNIGDVMKSILGR